MRHANHATQILICSLIITTACLFGGVKLQVREGRPIVDDVYVNGHGPYRFLVDTGSNINLIETGIAKKIGMNASFQVDLASAAGKLPTPGTDGNEVTLDSVKANGQKFLFSGLGAIHNSSPDVQGVLGQWFLARFDYAIDLHGKRLEFGKQERNGIRVKFTMLNGRMLVPSSLGDLVLDSGASRLTLFGVESDGGSRALVRTLTRTQAIGTVNRKLVIEARDVWRGDAMTMPSRTEPGVAGLLPLSLFKVTYVCNSEGYVIFE